MNVQDQLNLGVDVINSDLNIVAEDNDTMHEIMLSSNVDQGEEGYDQTLQGMSVFLSYLIENNKEGEELRVSKRIIEDLIGKLDQLISIQMDEIIHNEEFKELEATWRELKFLVDRTDFNENIKIEILNISKEELLNDFEDNVEVFDSGLYKKIYIDEFGQFGGSPYGSIVSSFAFNKSKEDTDLLRYMGSIGAMCHAPFIGNVDPKFFGLNKMEDLSNIRDLNDELESPKYRHWNSLRDAEDARNIGLCLPKFLLREPYGTENPTKLFAYNESTAQDQSNYCWGAASFALLTRLNDSFAKYRWCPNIIGPQSGGSVEDLSTEVFSDKGTDKTFGPTELTISDRNEFQLSELGFISLTVRKNSDQATFFSASSIQRSRYFGNDDEAKQKEVNFKLGTQLPYLFVINRLAHYLKVLQRENLGSWKKRSEIEDELNRWIRQYVADQENPSSAIRSQRPLRQAKITVTEDTSMGAGWYKVDMAITPHFKFMGASFTLSLSSQINNEEE